MTPHWLNASRSESDFLCSFLSLLPGFEAAQHFLQSRQVPDNWKVDLSEILESSSSDEEDHNEDIEGKAGEEEEKEPEPEEVRLQYYFVISISLPWNRVSFKSSTYLSSWKDVVCCWRIQKLVVLENCGLVFRTFEPWLFFPPFWLSVSVYALAWMLVSWSQWLACSFAVIALIKGVPELGTRRTEVIRGYLRPVPIERIPVLLFVDLWRHSRGPLHLMFSYTLIKPTEWSQHVGKPPGSGQQCLILPAPRVWTNGHSLGFPTCSHGNCSFLWLWKVCGIGPVEVCQFWWWAGLSSSQRVFSPRWRRSGTLHNYKASMWKR